MHIINNKKKQYDTHKTVFGFWLYIMSDCILFASLFAMYITLNSNCNSEFFLNKNIFKLDFIFFETFLLLLSSLTCSISMEYGHNMELKKVKKWLPLTLILGLLFINMEIYEFYHLIINGYGPQYNAFFSSYFVLVGTHGIHVAAGIIWIIVMIIHLNLSGLTHSNLIRLQCFSLFWHFLDIIWICVFTEVYLIGQL